MPSTQHHKERADARAGAGTGEVDDRLNDALQLAVGHLRGVFHRRIRAEDLTPPQAIALGVLSEPRSMGFLAELLSCDASNVTGIADRLEERGLVRRTASQGDRRVKLLEITTAGRALQRRLSRPVLHDVPGLAELSARDRATLAMLLERAFTEPDR